MPNRFCRALTLTVLALLAGIELLAAQDSKWEVRVFPEAGYVLHMRNLGKNTVALVEQSVLQTVAELEDAPVLGAGIEFAAPGRSIRFTGRVNATVGATAVGLLAICQSDQVVEGEGFCEIQEEVDATLLDASLEATFVRIEQERAIRPLFMVGLGLRNHGFDNDLSACDRYTGDSLDICVRAREIFENPSTNPFLTFGLGLETDWDPFSGFVQVRTIAGQYSGGAGIADGETHIDLVLTGGFTFRVR